MQDDPYENKFMKFHGLTQKRLLFEQKQVLEGIKEYPQNPKTPIK